MSEDIAIDYTNMLAPRIGPRGLDPDALTGLAHRFADSHARVESRRAAGDLGFLDLPRRDVQVRQIRTFAEGIGQAFDTVVVLGIGGSALGAQALLEALRPPRWNELSDEQREYFPRLFILDNIDPTTIGPVLDRLDLARTLFNVISKSGSTAETMAQFLIVRERLRSQLDDDGYRRHVIFTTDPEKGVLRRIARDEAIPALEVPPSVGGRFSVLSAVGLLPAALVGIDVEQLLAGAARMEERCRTAEPTRNPAGLFAALQYLAHEERGAGIHVMMSYGDRLAGAAEWFRQLWAESLGKRHDSNGREVFRGPTPVKAVGVTDQHSQVQLFMEGPFDKTVTILAADRLDTDVPIPSAYPDVEELAYLGGRSLGELLRAERQATTHALAEAGRMNMTIELPAIEAHTVGQLLMMLQIATVYAGGLYDVDPLDQPGVELGKRLTYALMGRPGFDRPDAGTPDERWVLR